MASTFWKKAAAVAIGTSIASVVAVVLAPPDWVLLWQNRVELWNQYQVELARSQADLYREQVLASLNEGTPGDWCGSYHYSNGFEGCVLDLGPGGFHYEASNCTGTTELAYGKITSVEGTRIRLEFLEQVIVERPPSSEGRQRFRLSAELYSVPWGEQRFLVPAELMTEFCSLARAGGWDSMKYADYPLRIAPGKSVWDRPLSLEELPAVPAEFRRYLPE